MTDDLLSVHKHKGQDCAEAHKDDEGNVSAIFHARGLPNDIDVCAQGDLRSGQLTVCARDCNCGQELHTKEPTQAPTLKIPQNHAQYRPFMSSFGYDSIMAP